MNCLKQLMKPNRCVTELTWQLRGKFHTTSVYEKAERTFLLLKPDAVQRRLTSTILGRLEQRGYKLVAMKLIKPEAELWRTHYSHIANKPFFPDMLKYMQSGPVVAMVWEGEDVVAQGQQIIGATNPSSAAVGTVRGDYSISVGRNIAHRSDSVENAEKEINMWFREDEIINWDDPLDHVINEVDGY